VRFSLRVLWMARRHAAWLVLAVVCTAIVAASTVFAYNLIRPIYDELLGPSTAHVPAPSGLVVWLDDRTTALRGALEELVGGSRAAILALVVLSIGCKAGATFGGRYAVARLGLATLRELREQLFDALLRHGPGWFGDRPTPTLVSRAVSDVAVIREAVAERFGEVFQDALTVAALVVYLWSLEPRLALVVTVVAPLLMTPVAVLARRLRRRTGQMQERVGDLATVMDEAVRGLMVVQAFGAEAPTSSRFRRASHRQFVAELRARALQLANGPVMEVVGAAAAAALIGWASVRITAGKMSLGDFSAFVVAAYGTYGPLKRLNKFYLAVQQADVAAGRILEVVDAPPAVVDLPGAVDLEGLGDGIRFDRVWFAYRPDDWVLREVSLEIPTGATVALVGPSGAGKTTIARLIPRFWDPQRGTVSVAGRDLRTVRVASLRRLVGVVTQEPLLFDLPIREVIGLGRPDADMGAIEAAARAALAHDFVAALPMGYDTRIGEAGARLSGGQRQRLAIARALLADPRLLILDEAMSALDADSERQVRDALERLMDGRTTLVIAHRLATVRRADDIVVLADGRVAGQGRHEQLLEQHAVYRSLVRAQQLT
jgi:subfamily B ATP-binding cassette protein MsbA